MGLKVTKCTPVSSEIIDLVGDADWTTFERHSADSWLVLMGESWEPVWDCDVLERAYQEFKAKQS